MTKHGDNRVKGKARKTRRDRRSTPDEILGIGHARLHNGKLELAPVERAESLCPSQNTLERAVLFEDQRAIEILLAWKFVLPEYKH